MKKLLIGALLLVLAASVFARGGKRMRIPNDEMTRITTATTTKWTADYYFNSKNSLTGGVNNAGAVDLNVYDTDYNADAGDGTITIEVYGIKRINIAGDRTLCFIDSTNVVTTATCDSTLDVYQIDPLFANFKMYDGLRFRFKTATNDSLYIDHCLDVYVGD